MCDKVANLNVREVLGLDEVLKQVGLFLKGGNTYSTLCTLPLVSGEESLERVHRRFVSPIIEYLKANNDFPCAGWQDLTQIFEEVFKKGFFLEELALLDLAYFLLETKKVRSIFLKNNLGQDLNSWALNLPDLDYLAEKLTFFIKRDGELNEVAVPEMQTLRSSIFQARQSLIAKAKKFLEHHTSYMREDIVEREGRVLLCLKSNFKGRLKGFVHSSSSSGQTLFFEPYELAELNNEKIRLEQDYYNLRLRILRALSEEIRLYATPLEQLWQEMAVFDTWRARALYAIDTLSCYPQSCGRSLCLQQARHPLLKNPVPIDLCLPEGKRALVITGPNAGGKTLTIKTVGLLALMNQLGIPVPVSELSSLPIFDHIFADIGDGQSLVDNLSTFSARMKKVAYLQAQASEKSLVLLDELASATDPEQGLALAQALLEDLMTKNCLLLCSTHFSYLKYLAYTHPVAINACLTVEKETLSPTFCIQMGSAGESYAFNVAKRQGLAHHVLERAQALYDSKQTQESMFMEKLACKERELSLEKDLLKKKLQEVSLSLSELKTKQEIISRREEELLEREIKQETFFVKQSRQVLEKMQEEFFLSSNKKETWKKCKEEVKNWQEYLEEKKIYKDSLKSKKESSPLFKEGAHVRLKAYGTKGVLIRPDKKDTWLVYSGSLKMALPSSELELIEESKNNSQLSVSQKHLEKGFVKMQTKAVFCLDVRGMRLHEAIKTVSAQLDSACVEGLMRFSLIHGMGNGVLQGGLHKFLKDHIHVKNFHFADANEGGTGKTWVYLKT